MSKIWFVMGVFCGIGVEIVKVVLVVGDNVVVIGCDLVCFEWLFVLYGDCVLLL